MLYDRDCVVEWEDMFPYEGELEELAAGDCYSKEDVQRMLALANENSLSVIPLVQTFDHMEFALKGEKYRALREVSYCVWRIMRPHC